METNSESAGDNLRRILKDKDAMLEVARLAAEDQRKAMSEGAEWELEFEAKLCKDFCLFTDQAQAEHTATWWTKRVAEIVTHQRQQAVAEFAREVVDLLDWKKHAGLGNTPHDDEIISYYQNLSRTLLKERGIEP